MSSVHKEAWEALYERLLKGGELERIFLPLMEHYLEQARQRAKEYQEKIKKELDKGHKPVKIAFMARGVKPRITQGGM